MVTGVLMKNPHAAHHSANQATSGTKLDTSDMRPRNTHDTRQTLDQTVDRILAKLKSPLGESGARAVVETLEKVRR